MPHVVFAHPSRSSGFWPAFLYYIHLAALYLHRQPIHLGTARSGSLYIFTGTICTASTITYPSVPAFEIVTDIFPLSSTGVLAA